MPDYLGEQLWRAQNKNSLWEGFLHAFANIIYLADVDAAELESESESDESESESDESESESDESESESENSGGDSTETEYLNDEPDLVMEV